jgi:hypothetical protein
MTLNKKIKHKLKKKLNIKKNRNIDYFSIFLGLIIFVIIILQIKKPFLTNSVNDIINSITLYFNSFDIKKETMDNINNLDEESLIRINNKGVDNINFNSDKNISRPKFMVQNNTLNTSIINEGFEDIINDNIKLLLFYQHGCPYSEQFLSLWTQIKEVLPLNIITKEINCDKKDVLGFSQCHQYNINKVPSIMLEKPDLLNNNEVSRILYRGKKDYLSIKQWLKSNNITLKHNAEIEHFDKYGNNTSVEKFKEIKSGYTGNMGNLVLSAEGNLRAPYDKLYKDASKVNEHGDYYDVDDDGCPTAYFSKCKENSVNPGYQIFTHRGQWGCVYPDKNTSLNNGFDAAFAAADQYLQTLPPKMTQEIDENGNISLKVEEYSAEDKIKQMKKCAIKYKDELRSFGLCDNKKLDEKYMTKELIEKGKLKVPFNGMNSNNYNDTKETAEAIYNACSI